MLKKIKFYTARQRHLDNSERHRTACRTLLSKCRRRAVDSDKDPIVPPWLSNKKLILIHSMERAKNQSINAVYIFYDYNT
jgi:hypothetical protein